MSESSDKEAIAIQMSIEGLFSSLKRANHYIAQIKGQERVDDDDDDDDDNKLSDDISSSVSDSDSDDDDDDDYDEMKEPNCKAIEFYVNLFMKLIPSLDRLRAHSFVPKQLDIDSSRLPIHSASQSSLAEATKYQDLEGLKPRSQDQQASGLAGVDSPSNTKFAVKDYLNEWRRMKRMDAAGMSCYDLDDTFLIVHYLSFRRPSRSAIANFIQRSRKSSGSSSLHGCNSQTIRKAFEFHVGLGSEVSSS